MSTFRNVVVASTFMVSVATGPIAYAQASENLDGDIQKIVGDVFKIAGPVTIGGASGTVKANDMYRTGTILSVPVVFARTARLDSDVHASTGQKWGWDNDVVIPAGTMMYHATFRRLATASTPLEAWCANQSYKWGVFHDKTGFSMYCIAKDKDGKAIGLYSGASTGYLGGAGYYPDKPQWFAFSLSGQHSQPFEYPSITETEMPSPPMTLSLTVEAQGKDQPDVVAVWTLTGPANGDPAMGMIWRAPAAADANHLQVRLGAHVLTMDYTSATKSIGNLKIADGTSSDTVQIGMPMYYWLDYEVGAPAPLAQPVEDTPWQFGAEHVNPETVSISGGSLAKGDTLLSAKAQLGQRYRLKTVLLGWNHNSGFSAGAEAYQSSETRRGPDGTLYRNDYWCIKGATPGVQCVPASLEQMPGGQGRVAWQLSPFSQDVFEGINVTPYRPEFFNVGYRPVAPLPDPDPAPTVDMVQMRVSDIQKGYVTITLGLLDGDSFHGARSFPLAFNSSGDATLSLWTKRVHLHNAGKMVSITAVEDVVGDGPQMGSVYESAK